MSEFWDDLQKNAQDGFKTVKDAAVDAFNTVAGATGDLVNKGKDAMNATTNKRVREESFTELGKMFYQQMDANDLNMLSLQEKCAEIHNLSVEIDKEEKSVSKDKDNQ